MKIMKKILCTVLVVVLCLTSAPLSGFVGLELPEWDWKASAATELAETGQCGDNVYWNFDSNTGELVISGTGEMYDYMFNSPFDSNCYIKNVIIKYGITTIGSCAFMECENLIDVDIPDSITKIGVYAFSSCENLKSVCLPDSLITIEREAFKLCTNLASFEVDKNNINYSSDNNGILFNKEKTILIQYPIGNSSLSYTIPDGVITISDYAFGYCNSLTSVTIPESVTTIGSDAFSRCGNLQSIIIPDSVTDMGEAVFYNCYSLQNVTIGNSVTSIGVNTFFDCGKLKSITIPDSVTTIGASAFCYCDSLQIVTIPESVTTIAFSAFESCDNLQSIMVDKNNSTYSSDNYGVLFDKNKNTLIQYPSGNNRSSYIIPDSTTSIGSYSFVGCDSLQSIIIPNNVISIGEWAFESCYNLKEITIPNSVTSIGRSAFSYCGNLESIIIGDGVTSIGYELFYGCTKLASIVIPDSVTKIAACAFESCTRLTSITIPNSVIAIGEGAFYDCDSLTDVYYNGTNNQWNKISIYDGNEYMLNATIHFLGEEEPDEPKPDGYKLKLWSDGVYSDSIAVGESIGFDVYLLENGKYLDCERPYAVSFDVQGIFEVSQIKTSSDSMYIKLRANKAGTTNMTISDNVTGAYVTVKLKADNKIKALTLYEFDDSAKKQDDILTHIYNQNGIYINGFNVNENRDGSYHVVMNAYNEKAHYGAVVAYDKDGNITDYDLIKQKKKLPTNLWSGTFDVFDWVTYKFEVFGEKPYTHLGCTQWTPIDIKVPKDGHLVITNNTANEMAFLANMTDLAIDFAFAYVDFIFDDIPENTSDKVIEITIGQLIKKMGEKALSKFCSDFIEKLTVKMTFANISTVLNNFVKALEDEGIDFYDIVVEALGDTVNEELFYNIGEDIGLLLAGGPIQDILKACDYTNTLIKMYDMGGSILSPQTIVKAPPAEEKVRISNGVTVTSEKPLDPKYVLHTYVINQNDVLMTDAVPTIDPLADNYNMYDITLYKSGEAVQPDAKIKVMIPIPAGYDKSRISVYWYKEDGTLEKMNATVNGSYAIFETDHLSYYVLVEEHVHTYGEDGEICTDCGFDRTEGCGCNCHKTGIPGLFWKIINFFNKIFKIKQYCDCGVKHY